MKLAGCSIGYPQGEALRSDIDYEFGLGLYLVDGANGSGKSTLLRTLCGVLKPLAGSVTVAGVDVHDVPAVRSHISYLPHRLAGQASLRVKDYLRFWADLRKRRRAEEELRRLAAAFGLHELAERKMGTLSRGQTQRVALIKTLSAVASILVLDEPFTGLDTRYTDALVRELDARVWDGATAIVSQHGPHAIRDRPHIVVDMQRLGTRAADWGIDDRP